jgi:hypothetical protein
MSRSQTADERNGSMCRRGTCRKAILARAMLMIDDMN